MQTNEGNRSRASAPPSARIFVEAVECERERLLYRIRRKMGPVLLALCEPEDILQEALIIGCRESRRLYVATTHDVCRWLSSIAANRILDLSRRMRQRQRPRIATTLPASLLLGVPIRELEIVATKTEKEPPSTDVIVDRPLGTVGGLGSDQRLSVLMHDVLDLPWNTTAFLLDRTVPASRKLHQRARYHLDPNLAPGFA